MVNIVAPIISGLACVAGKIVQYGLEECGCSKAEVMAARVGFVTAAGDFALDMYHDFQLDHVAHLSDHLYGSVAQYDIHGGDLEALKDDFYSSIFLRAPIIIAGSYGIDVYMDVKDELNHIIKQNESTGYRKNVDSSQVFNIINNAITRKLKTVLSDYASIVLGTILSLASREMLERVPIDKLKDIFNLDGHNHFIDHLDKYFDSLDGHSIESQQYEHNVGTVIEYILDEKHGEKKEEYRDNEALNKLKNEFEDLIYHDRIEAIRSLYIVLHRYFNVVPHVEVEYIYIYGCSVKMIGDNPIKRSNHAFCRIETFGESPYSQDFSALLAVMVDKELIGLRRIYRSSSAYLDYYTKAEDKLPYEWQISCAFDKKYAERTENYPINEMRIDEDISKFIESQQKTLAYFLRTPNDVGEHHTETMLTVFDITCPYLLRYIAKDKEDRKVVLKDETMYTVSRKVRNIFGFNLKSAPSYQNSDTTIHIEKNIEFEVPKVDYDICFIFAPIIKTVKGWKDGLPYAYSIAEMDNKGRALGAFLLTVCNQEFPHNNRCLNRDGNIFKPLTFVPVKSIRSPDAQSNFTSRRLNILLKKFMKFRQYI